MKKWLLLLAITIFSICSSSTSAQQKTIKGTVTSAQDETPLPGVTVRIEDTNKGTTTDASGHYQLVASPGQKLIVSYIGYQQTEAEVGESNTIDVSLQPASSQLDEIAVTAFGVKQEVRSLGFSTQNVKGSEVVESQ